MFIPGHSTKGTIMIHIIVSSACCAEASELLYLFSVRSTWTRMEIENSHSALNIQTAPVGDVGLVQGWYITFELETRLCRPLSCPTQPFFPTPGTCSMTLGVQILDVGIDAHGLATKPFDSQHASINHWVNKWFVPSIHSRDGGINSNSLLCTCVILDGIIPSPRFLLTIFKSPYQISILYNMTMTYHDHPGFLGSRTRTPTFHISQELYAVTSV